MIRENVGNRYFREEWSCGRALTKWGATGRAPKPGKTAYRRPCDRSRLTGSTTAWRLKIQRATAKPIAA